MSTARRCPTGSRLRLELDRWYGQSPGKELREQELACLERLLADLFGYYLVQVGTAGGFREIIELSRVRNHIVLPESTGYSPLGAQIVAYPAQLPIASDSIDVVFLPHALNFAPDPHQVLREAERVLIPEGRVIIFGFNAWGLWGLWWLLRIKSARIPWCGNSLSQFRVIDWLSLLGFDVELQFPLMFRPPFKRPGLLARLGFMETMGGRYRLPLGGAYALRAVKRVSTLTPLRPRWNDRARVLPSGAVEPTTRSGGRV
jgi:SAM-dependent methyltransferase